MRRPLGVSMISYFYIFGGAVLLFTTIFYDAGADSIGIADRFGLPGMPEQLMRVMVAVFTFTMVYGYIRLTQWGFWLIVIYSVCFGSISFSLISNQHQQPFVGNLIFSIIVLVYTLYVREAFFKMGKLNTE